MDYINIHPLGIFLGIFAIICSAVWILRKDKLRKGFCKNWPDKAFYIWGITCLIFGFIVLININILNYAFLLLSIVFFGQSYYYNRKTKIKDTQS